MVHKSSVIVNLVRQFTEEIQMATAHVKRKKRVFDHTNNPGDRS